MFDRVNELLKNIKITEVKDITQTSTFKKWFGESQVTDSQGNPLLVYHGTREDFSRFNWKFSSQGVHWFSSNKDKILRGESGANSSKILLHCYLKSNKLAGWKEYDKYSLQEIKSMGFDGIKLDDDYIVYDSNQIKIIKRETGDV